MIGGQVPGNQFICRECGHMFKTAPEQFGSQAERMCPSCGGIDLEVIPPPREAPVRMAAVTKAPAQPPHQG
jgi:Zn finger protein HypA/HybF involved in hydrogenase expression